MIQFCECETPAETLVRFGFWPSSTTRPHAAFSIELLQLMHMLTLQCSVSVEGFVQSLRWLNNMSASDVCIIFNCKSMHVVN